MGHTTDRSFRLADRHCDRNPHRSGPGDAQIQAAAKNFVEDLRLLYRTVPGHPYGGAATHRLLGSVARLGCDR